MKEIGKEKSCCACSACMNVCAHQAIQMITNEDGFTYPQIEKDKCVNCGLCIQACNYQKEEKKVSAKIVYAAATNDTDPFASASGGLFASFAKHVIVAGGVVYGCALIYESGVLHPRHIRVSEPDKLYLLQGSKYVQSDIGLIYQEVQRDLRQNRMVLFTGTPCQVDGLKGYLHKEYDNLFTIDIICHGVPGSQMFQDYLRFVEKKKKKKVIEYKFRDKSNGWKLSGKMILEDADGQQEEILFAPEKSSYYQMFLDSYTYRVNCYTCPYACDNRPGDITIGDYWCIDLIHPEYLIQNGGKFDERKGISCLIINNHHGENMMKKFGSGIHTEKSSFEKASKYNGQLTHPSVLKPERKIVLEKYAQGYEVLEKWYHRKRLPVKIKRAIRAAVPRWMKNGLKNMMRR